ncbi:hypothetical protein [Pseudoroseomonas sp. WGS1072]|uniref:hypothetical protein n=1 Tax=Roseomonas sp. WGS1072 TaxID=3366816 RepID=UPI003BF1158E
MRQLIEIAERHALDLTLEVDEDLDVADEGEGARTPDELVSWYLSLGFSDLGRRDNFRQMVRCHTPLRRAEEEPIDG